MICSKGTSRTRAGGPTPTQLQFLEPFIWRAWPGRQRSQHGVWPRNWVSALLAAGPRRKWDLGSHSRLYIDRWLSSPAQAVLRSLGHCGHRRLDLSPGEAAGEASWGPAPAQGHPLRPPNLPAGRAAALAAAVAQLAPAARAAAIFVGAARPPATGFTVS